VNREPVRARREKPNAVRTASIPMEDRNLGQLPTYVEQRSHRGAPSRRGRFVLQAG